MSKMSLNGLPPPPLAVLRGHNDSVISVKFLKNILLFSGAANGKLRLWNLRNMRTDVHIAAHDSSILSINTDLESRVIT